MTLITQSRAGDALLENTKLVNIFYAQHRGETNTVSLAPSGGRLTSLQFSDLEKWMRSSLYMS